MSRKIILSLAAATLAVATLSSQADARGFGGGGFGGGRAFGGGHPAMASFTGHGGRTLTPIFPGHGHPVIPGPFPHGHPNFPGHWVFHHHDHGHWVFRFGRWIVVDDVVDEAPAPVVAAPGPCTCLTKTYTPSGLVVFADVCTKEFGQRFGRRQRRRHASADHAGGGERGADVGGADRAELRRPHL